MRELPYKDRKSLFNRRKFVSLIYHGLIAMTLSPQVPPLVHLAQATVTLPGPTGPVSILRGVNLDLAAGETVSLVGPSTAPGKTTLLMVIAGLERATSGLVRVAGKDLSLLGEDELARFRR